jgi:hypothetical protein
MSRAEVLALVATAVDNVSGPLRGAQKAVQEFHKAGGQGAEVYRKQAEGLKKELWPAPGSEDTELGVLMELEVGHGETDVYAGVQA